MAAGEERLLARLAPPNWACGAHEDPTPVPIPRGEGGHVAHGPHNEEGLTLGWEGFLGEAAGLGLYPEWSGGF